MAYYVLKEKAPLASVVAESSVYPSRRTEAPATGLRFRIGDTSLHAVCGDGLYRDVGRGVVVVYGYSFCGLKRSNPNLLAVTV